MLLPRTPVSGRDGGFLGLRSEVTRTGGLTRQALLVRGSGSRSLRSRCRQDRPLWRLWGRVSAPPTPPLLGAAGGGPWGSLARRGVASASGGVSSWHDPCASVCPTPVLLDGEPALLSCDLALATPQMTPFPSTAIFQGSRKDTKPGGGGHHPTQRSRGSASTAPLSAPSPAPEAGRPSQGDVLLDKAALPCGAPPRAGDAVPAPPAREARGRGYAPGLDRCPASTSVGGSRARRAAEAEAWRAEPPTAVASERVKFQKQRLRVRGAPTRGPPQQPAERTTGPRWQRKDPRASRGAFHSIMQDCSLERGPAGPCLKHLPYVPAKGLICPS